MEQQQTNRIALGIEYDGSNYYGWQRQSQVTSVQLHLEKALSKVANHPVAVLCAGRTDAGVHATGQVVHFETPAFRPERSWTLGVNTHLPKDIAVKWAKQVSPDFHARFSAVGRRYRYIIYNNPFRPAILAGGLTHMYTELDHQKMHEAAQCLVGEHDFSAFRASLCQANSPVRRLEHIQVTRRGQYIMIDVQANAFLHHMVRNITGSLAVIGSGEQPVEWMKKLLDQKDRAKAGATAKPNGLYLVDVLYPEHFGIPEIPLGPAFF
ncbi:tRNA pseudouridine(38-40) synthase TruA [Aliiglaciecola sp. 2_MG-2023]|uniref:tRNA pseudouridine(38-40) synthase TruA n=1 Tax=Alteromonadaceae TaxID=72275 RepID=UPI0026E205B1|nr:MULTISPECIES: tRNA pseudouridine(38-40) synthase TruA [unclassified Aliiglaciecola]MDO6711023.1 tRNA pseudouridine(38-40) synthase TruA [Aliiglaciecola sp. 2_MG-2023]MDO6754233.1 tRNA pseudouridine(38-40) synthase TruA [Aliiglaciecola sp. 1_MG-2023]